MMDVDFDLDRRASPESVDRFKGSDKANTTSNAVVSTTSNPSTKTPHSANVTSIGSASRRSHITPGSGAYNCIACYHRKIKCDRRLDGCSNCTKAGITCIYTPQRNVAMQKRGPYSKSVVKKNEELEQKILALEATVQNLNKKIHNRSLELSVELQGTSISMTRPGQGIPTPMEDVIFANDLRVSKSGSRDNGSSDSSTREEGATRLRASNSNGTAGDFAKYSTGPFETTLNKFRSRVTELRKTAGSDTSSMQSSLVMSGRQSHDSNPITPDGSYSHPWITAERESGLPFPRTSRPSLSESLTLPSGPLKYPAVPSMEFSRPNDISNASASLGLEGSTSGLRKMVTTPGLTFANLISGSMSPGNWTSDLHDIYMSKTTWFQFQDETMGINVEEFTDGSWEDSFRGLPVFK
jgi:hypothetical protein